MSETSPKEYFRNKKRYVQVGQLGRGGMAIVFESRDEYFQRKIAFKTLKDGPNRTKRETEFIREAMIMAKLEHPGVVPIHGLITDVEELPSITMGKVKGLSLQAKIQESRKDPESWPLNERLKFFLKLVEIVAYSHNRGVLHRDIKPGNIMIGEVGEVILLDWGLAKVMEIDPEEEQNDEDSTISRIDDTVLTSMESMSGSIKGTPYYMSPESARGRSELVNEQSDVFSLGAVLYELITFEFYINGTKAMEVLSNAADSNTKPLGKEDLKASIKADTKNLPPEITFILKKSVAPEKLFRYRDAIELQRDLIAYFNDKPIPGFGDGLGVYRFRKWFSRNGLSLMLLTIPILITSYIAQLINEESIYLENQLLFEKDEFNKKRAEKKNFETELARLKKQHELLLAQKTADQASIEKIKNKKTDTDIDNITLSGDIEDLEIKITNSKALVEKIKSAIDELSKENDKLDSTFENLIQIQKRKKELEQHAEFLKVTPLLGKEFKFIQSFVENGKVLSSLEYIQRKELFSIDPFVTKWYTNNLTKRVSILEDPDLISDDPNEVFFEGEPKFIQSTKNNLQRINFLVAQKLENYYPGEEWSHFLTYFEKTIYYSKSGKVLQHDSKNNQYLSFVSHNRLPLEVSVLENKSLIGRYNEEYVFFQKTPRHSPVLIYHREPVIAYDYDDTNNQLLVEDESFLWQYKLTTLTFQNLGWEYSKQLDVEEVDIDFKLDATEEEYDNLIPANYNVINSKMPLGPWLMVNRSTPKIKYRNLDPQTGIIEPLWETHKFNVKSAISDGYEGWLLLTTKGEIFSLKPKLPALPLSPQSVYFESIFPLTNWNISISQDKEGQVYVHYLSTGQYLFNAGAFPKIESVNTDKDTLQLSFNLSDGKTIVLDL